jgi:hypothetical protein
MQYPNSGTSCGTPIPGQLLTAWCTKGHITPSTTTGLGKPRSRDPEETVSTGVSSTPYQKNPEKDPDVPELDFQSIVIGDLSGPERARNAKNTRSYEPHTLPVYGPRAKPKRVKRAGDSERTVTRVSPYPRRVQNVPKQQAVLDQAMSMAEIF